MRARGILRTALLGVLAWGAAGTGAGAPPLQVWRLEGGRVHGEPGASRAPAAVGSLQKPFLAQAWAAAHPDRPTPRWRCHGRSCWLRAGHGTLGLARAVAVSCNEYFLALAADTPPPLLKSTLLAEGFVADGPMSPGAAVGLEETVAIAPARLLQAYLRLTRTPWLGGEAVRREVLSGLRQAAVDGTASGLARHGYWAKTGTVDVPGRERLETIGWALAVDDAGRAILGRLQPGTGRQAARALAAALDRPGPDAQGIAVTPPPQDRVRVLLFEAARPRAVVARNGGAAPVAAAGGYIGPGASRTLRPGDRLAESLWELELPESRLRRRVQAALTVSGTDGSGGRLRVVAEMDAREYVAGTIAAELPPGAHAHRVAVGAAALRWRERGARHAEADVCDTTHCAWFIGRGPRVRWPTPHRALLGPEAGAALDEDEWARIREAARAPGPAHWTAHCGGRPLSPHALWGNQDRRALPCPLHRHGPARPWTRRWDDAALERAFGAPVRRLEAGHADGVYRLTVVTAAGRRRLLYDDAHRALAAALGWGAMPSPPERVVRTAGGFHAEGVGLGHRVGLCLDAADD